MLYEEPNMIIKIKPEYLHRYYCVLKHYVYRIMFVILKTNYKASTTHERWSKNKDIRSQY